VLLIRRAAHPHVAFLGRIPGTRSFSDIGRNPDNEAVPGVLVFRVEASLIYFNVEHVREAVWQKIRSTTEPLKLVVCDLSTSPAVDLAGARMLASLHTALQAAGIRLRWSARMRECATSCAPKNSRNASATSDAASRWPTPSTNFRAVRQPLSRPEPQTSGRSNRFISGRTAQ